jgi:1,2-diacylglycerol 3-beta-galactosyltransferase
MPERKHILVVTADAGFGHRSAAKAVAAAIQDAYSEACTVEIVNPLDDRRAPAILRETQSDYDKFVRQMPDLWRLNYQISDSAVPGAVVERGLTILLFRVMRSIIKKTQPDAIVCTHPFFMAPMNAYITIRKLGIPFLTSITDLSNIHRMWFHQGADLCLLPTQEAYDQALSSSFPSERLVVTGIPVHPAFVKETRAKDELRADLGWAAGMTTVLVVGSKRVKNLMSVLHLLNHSGLPIQLVLVAGGDDALFSQLKSTEWHTATHLYNFVTTMPQFMRAADMIISKAGGLTVTESLASGLPLLLVDVTPGQEEGNAAYVLDHGAGELAENPVEALEILYHWLDRDAAMLRERARNSAELGRPRSAYVVAELARQAALNGRLVPKSRLREWAPKIMELLRSNDISVSDDLPGLAKHK